MKVGDLFVTLSVDMSQYDAAMTNAQKKATSLGSILKNALSFTLGMGAWQALKTGIENTIGAGIKFNATLQQNETAFTTMLGSAEKAQGLVTQLIQMAAKTPFETSDLTQAAQLLMNFGVAADKVLPSLKMLGDVSQGNRERFNALALAFAQVQANGRLTGQDLLQMVNAGFNPLMVISEKTGKSMAELREAMEKGQISAQDVANAFIIATSAGGKFYNGMERQSKTFSGLLSTLRDNLNITFGTVARSLFDWLTNTALPKLISWTSQFVAYMQAGGLRFAIFKMFGADALQAYMIIVNVVRGVWSVLTGIFNFIRSNWGILKPLIISGLSLYASIMIVTKSMGLLSGITSFFARTMQVANGEMNIASGLQLILARAIQYYRVQLALANMEGITSVGVLTKMGLAFKALWASVGPVGWIVLAITVLIEVIMWAAANQEKAKYMFLQAWGGIKIGVLGAIYGILWGIRLLLGWIPGVGGMLTNWLGAIGGAIKREVAVLSNRRAEYKKAQANANKFAINTSKLKNIVDKVGDSSNRAAQGVNNLGKSLKNAGKAASDNLQSFDEIHQLQSEANQGGGGGGIGNIPTPALGGFAGDLANINTQLDDFNKSIEDMIANMDEMSNKTDETTSKTGGFWQWLSGVWEKVKTGWTNLKNEIANWEIWKKLGETWDNLKKKLPTWDEIKNTIITKWNDIKNNLLRGKVLRPQLLRSGTI